MAAPEKRFYVYLLKDRDVPAYIGKGSGRRLKVQERNFALKGEVLEWHDNEDACYRAERKWIKELKPYYNRHPGGNGSRAAKAKRYRRTKEEIEMERVGTRVYAARILLGVHRSAPHLIDASKLDDIRRVAYGCGA